MRKIIALYNEFTSFEGSIFKYALSFSLLLALAPSLIIFVMLFRFDASLLEELILFVERFIPKEYITTFVTWFIGENTASLVSSLITLVISFWLASRSIFSFLLISAKHEAVYVPKIAVRIRSIYLFLLFALYVVGALVIGTACKAVLPLVSVILILIAFYLLYRSLSFRRRELSYGVVGSMFCTTSILLVSVLFFAVLNYFTSYSDIYGPLASLVTLLLSIYVISCIIYFGFCLNLVWDDHYGRERYLPLKAKWFYDKVEKMFNLIHIN